MSTLPPPLEVMPTTHMGVFEELQRLFGLGTDQWKDKAAETAKIKRICTRRRVSIEQLMIAAWFAKTRHITILNSAQLFPLIPQAQRAWTTEETIRKRASSDAVVHNAVVEAFAAGEEEWAERLLRADAKSVVDVVAQWEAHQQEAQS